MDNLLSLFIFDIYRHIPGIENPRVGGSIPPLGTILKHLS